MAQMKEQMKTPKKELNKMEVRNLSDAEFKTQDTERVLMAARQEGGVGEGVNKWGD